MFWAPICPSSGVQLVNIPLLGPYLESRLEYSLQEVQCSTTQAAFQVWPPKSGRYSLIVLLMMGILVLKHVEAIKTANFVASSRFFTFTVTIGILGAYYVRWLLLVPLQPW
jgi:hypothetical protein